MDKGFVVFRDPQDGIIRAWQGTFTHKDVLPSTNAHPQFLIKPWVTDSQIQVLETENSTNNYEEIKHWLENIHPQYKNPDADSQREDFIRYVNRAKSFISEGTIDKVVTARKKTRASLTKSPIDSFYAICEAYPSAFNYLLFHPEFGLWIGASPEIFLHLKNTEAHTVALAGTLRSNTDQWTGKEYQEQGIIGRYVEEIFMRNHIHFQKEPLRTAQAGPLRHLEIKYHFALPPQQVSGWLNEFHPTPAVGGYPKQPAIDFISAYENMDRELYSGWLGWRQGDSLKTWVNLRCARLFEDKAILFAGCGINSGSDAEQEWLETEAKMNVIGSCLG